MNYAGAVVSEAGSRGRNASGNEGDGWWGCRECGNSKRGAIVHGHVGVVPVVVAVKNNVAVQSAGAR